MVEFKPNGVIELQLKIGANKTTVIRLLTVRQEKVDGIKEVLLEMKEMRLDSDIKHENSERKIMQFQEIIAAQGQ